MELEGTIRGVLPQSNGTTETLTKLREIFELAADGVKKQSTAREHQEYMQSQRMVKAAQSREETEAWNTEEAAQTPERMKTQAQTRKGNLGAELQTKETQRVKWITTAKQAAA